MAEVDPVRLGGHDLRHRGSPRPDVAGLPRRQVVAQRVEVLARLVGRIADQDVGLAVGGLYENALMPDGVTGRRDHPEPR